MRNALLLAALLGNAVVVGGCSSSSTAATPDAGSGKDASSGTDTGAPATDSGAPASDAAACTGTADLYHRLGCEPGITTAVSAIATAELANADIASYFAYIGMKDATGYTHPTAGQIESCLVSFLSHAVGGPDPYPTTTADGFACRPMSAAHADLYISGGSFDTFVMIAASTLTTAGVSSADLMTIGAALEGLKPTIVNPALADAGTETLTQGIQEADAGDQ